MEEEGARIWGRNKEVEVRKWMTNIDVERSRDVTERQGKW